METKDEYAAPKERGREREGERRESKRENNNVNLFLIYSWPARASLQKQANIFYSRKREAPPAGPRRG